MPTASCEPVPGLVLRPAAPEDALCLSVLAMQVFLDTYATQGIRTAIAREVLSGYSEVVFAGAIAHKQARICVAEVAGHLVGFGHVTLGQRHALVPMGEQSELLRLYVQERFTGKQVGTLLLAEAERLTGVPERTALVRAGLVALIEQESARRLARLGPLRSDRGG